MSIAMLTKKVYNIFRCTFKVGRSYSVYLLQQQGLLESCVTFMSSSESREVAWLQHSEACMPQQRLEGVVAFYLSQLKCKHLL